MLHSAYNFVCQGISCNLLLLVKQEPKQKNECKKAEEKVWVWEKTTVTWAVC